MPRNGSGGYAPPTNSWNPATVGNSATPPDFNALLSDIATAITQSIAADGQTPITANIPMGSNKLTGLAQGVASGDSLSWEQLFSQGVETDVASAATCDIGAVNSAFIRITGTTTITSFGANYRGPRFIRFGGALQLTHNASTLILPDATNITTAAGDCAIVRPIGSPSSGWVVMSYLRAVTPVPQSRWYTGEWVLCIDATAPAGTVTPNGGTIGSASSGATVRANADTEALFTKLWGVTNNTDYPIQTSGGTNTTRGASAAVDFAANKRFPLPNVEDGDALIAAVSSAVLTRSVGALLAHTHSGTTTTNGAHSHTVARNLNDTSGPNQTGFAAPGFDGNNSGPTPTSVEGDHAHAFTTNSVGGTKNKAAGMFTRVYMAL